MVIEFDGSMVRSMAFRHGVLGYVCIIERLKGRGSGHVLDVLL